jgi:hypothetical protein
MLSTEYSTNLFVYLISYSRDGSHLDKVLALGATTCVSDVLHLVLNRNKVIEQLVVHSDVCFLP